MICPTLECGALLPLSRRDLCPSRNGFGDDRTNREISSRRSPAVRLAASISRRQKTRASGRRLLPRAAHRKIQARPNRLRFRRPAYSRPGAKSRNRLTLGTTRPQGRQSHAIPDQRPLRRRNKRRQNHPLQPNEVARSSKSLRVASIKLSASGRERRRGLRVRWRCGEERANRFFRFLRI